MKSKKLFILLIVLAVSTVFTGCNAINGAFDSLFLTTTEVEAKDLADFTGTTPTTDEEVLMGFMGGMGLAMSPAVALIPKSLGADYAEVERVLNLTIPGFAESRTADVESRKAIFSVDASVTDEVIQEVDTDPKITVTEASVKVNAKADSISDPTAVEADFTAKLELILEKVTTSGATLNEMNLNVNSKGNAKATLIDEVPQEVTFYAAADVSIGFSLTAPDTNMSGKYIFNFNYVQGGTVTKADITNSDYTGDAEEVSVTIEVYKNDDTLAKSVTYTQTKLMEIIATMTSPSAPY